MVISAIGNNSTKEDKVKLEEYWSCLQLEVADKIKELNQNTFANEQICIE